MKTQVKKGQANKKVRILTFIALSFFLLSCAAQNKIKKTFEIVVLEDSIIEPYVYLNELKVVSSEKINAEKTMTIIQELSENKNLQSKIPEVRLAKKKELLNNCISSVDSECEYVPERYTILRNKGSILNLKYSFNSFRNPDEYFKYACYDLEIGERITYNYIFLDSISVLRKYNMKYVQRYKTYIEEIEYSSDEEVIEESEKYKEHLETRVPFQLDDLNNFEFVYDDLGKMTHIRFHYNGQGGVYKAFFPPDYIDFSIEELRPLFRKDVLKRFKIE